MVQLISKPGILSKWTIRTSSSGKKQLKNKNDSKWNLQSFRPLSPKPLVLVFKGLAKIAGVNVP